MRDALDEATTQSNSGCLSEEGGERPEHHNNYGAIGSVATPPSDTSVAITGTGTVLRAQ